MIAYKNKVNGVFISFLYGNNLDFYSEGQGMDSHLRLNPNNFTNIKGASLSWHCYTEDEKFTHISESQAQVLKHSFNHSTSLNGTQSNYMPTARKKESCF